MSRENFCEACGYDIEDGSEETIETFVDGYKVIVHKKIECLQQVAEASVLSESAYVCSGCKETLNLLQEDVLALAEGKFCHNEVSCLVTCLTN